MFCESWIRALLYPDATAVVRAAEYSIRFSRPTVGTCIVIAGEDWIRVSHGEGAFNEDMAVPQDAYISRRQADASGPHRLPQSAGEQDIVFRSWKSHSVLPAADGSCHGNLVFFSTSPSSCLLARQEACKIGCNAYFIGYVTSTAKCAATWSYKRQWGWKPCTG